MSLFKPLVEKIFQFVKLYEETQDPMMLINCQKYKEYQEIIQVLDKFGLDDLKLDPEVYESCFVQDTIFATTLFEGPNVSVGYFFIPKGMYHSLGDFYILGRLHYMTIQLCL
jgi:hypothetical protein